MCPQKTMHLGPVIVLPVFVATCLCWSARSLAEQNQSKTKLDTAKIESVTGGKGAMNEQEGVFKVSWPRTDVKVNVDGMAMDPFMGLTSWVSFMPAEKTEAMIMGDLVLFQDEVNPVMSALLDNGLAVTALHNHFFFDEPKVYFMHIEGEGATEAMANGVKKALAV